MKLVNLFALMMKRKLPIILPHEMDFEEMELSEEVVKKDFSDVNLHVTELSPLLPPYFLLESAYPGGGWDLLELVVLTVSMAHSRKIIK